MLYICAATLDIFDVKIRTNITTTLGAGQGGGRSGPRSVEDSTKYLSFLTQAMAEKLNQRMETDEAQNPEDVAQVIINLIVNRQHARTLAGGSKFCLLIS